MFICYISGFINPFSDTGKSSFASTEKSDEILLELRVSVIEDDDQDKVTDEPVKTLALGTGGEAEEEPKYDEDKAQISDEFVKDVVVENIKEKKVLNGVKI